MNNNNLVILRRSDFTTAQVSAAPIVSMTIKDGKIQFNHAASKLLGLEDGDSIELGHAADNKRRLWFRKGSVKDGYRVHRRIPKRANGVHCIISKPLVRHMQELLGTEYNISVQLGTDPEDGVYWALESSYQFTKPRKLK